MCNQFNNLSTRYIIINISLLYLAISRDFILVSDNSILQPNKFRIYFGMSVKLMVFNVIKQNDTSSQIEA